MVKICNTEYTNEKYKEHFDKFPYSLSDFQKWAIEAIVTGNHIMVTAHTGSGKTLPAEFAIDYFVSQGKKVIYTSPIKALSNQKFHDFTEKYPNYTIGLLTGDIKTNPEADVLIMTTEILLNTLYKKMGNITSTPLMFDLDFGLLGCVVFDECHYINDPDRGKVWEESIMLLPSDVQLVMLSATIDAPEKFCEWIQKRGTKEVYLASTYHRVVPLTHYSFITCTQGLFKVLKDKQLEMEIMKFTNRLNMIQDAKGVFQEQKFLEVKKYLTLFEHKQHYVKRAHVLNQVCQHLVDNQMLPALCFVMSRKAIETCATEINTNLLEDDSKVPYIIGKECEQIIRKLPNYKEYLDLPEYKSLVKLLEKGIGIHHAGVIPVLREMVEILFAKGYIKLLFATESMAIGVNMPVKTTIFTDATKFDGLRPRMFYSHEYTQMAGRAGRRGLDSVGHVIHLNNLFRNMDTALYKQMMKGTPQKLVSKFKISYNLLLNLIETGRTDLTEYVKHSMIQQDINSSLITASREIDNINKDLEKFEEVLTTFCKEDLEAYISLCNKKNGLVNKKRKDAEREIARLETANPRIKDQRVTYEKYLEKKNELTNATNDFTTASNYLATSVQKVLDYLTQSGFVSAEPPASLTKKGLVSVNLREVHCLVFADLLEENYFDNMTSIDIACILSMFTNISVQDELKTEIPPTKEAEHISMLYDEERRRDLNTGFDYQYHFELFDYIRQWSEAQLAEECKQILENMEKEKEIFLGEFVKALLKINNIVEELKLVAELLGNVHLLSTLAEIPHNLLKYVVTNQSLYV